MTDAAAVTDAIARAQPDVVINCAAWTAVDDAEAAEEQALAVNAGGAANLAAACAARGARLVQVSTDYVFAGDAGRPYAEDDVPAPRTAYGRTKLAGEQAVLDRLPGSGYVVRTAWLYGAHGPSFVRTMISSRTSGRRSTSSTTSTASPPGPPTWPGRSSPWSDSAAPPGIYHATSSGQTTWFGLARRCSACSVPIRPGSGRYRAALCPGRRRGRYSGWVTAPGPRLAFRLSASGGRLCAAPFLNSAPRSGPRRRPVTGQIPGSARPLPAQPSEVGLAVSVQGSNPASRACSRVGAAASFPDSIGCVSAGHSMPMPGSRGCTPCSRPGEYAVEHGR